MCNFIQYVYQYILNLYNKCEIFYKLFFEVYVIFYGDFYMLCVIFYNIVLLKGIVLFYNMVLYSMCDIL